MRVQVSANPVLIKELRGRMRGPRAYLFLTACLALLGGVSYGLYRLTAATIQGSYGGVPQGALIGRSVFTGLVYVALMAVCGAAPFLTAGAISGEHERKTIDLLLATPLSPSSLLRGKLIAALSYVALVLLATVPLASLSFVFGGVSIGDMAKAFLMLLGFAVSLSVLGLFFSALFRRTGAALVASYVTLAAFVLGSLFVYVANGVVLNRQPPNWPLTPNPFVAMASLMAGSGGSSLGGFPGGDILGALVGMVDGRGMLLSSRAGGVAVLGSTAPLWQQTAGFYVWLTVVLYLASTQLVKPVRRFRLRPRTWAIVAVALLASLLAVPVVYGPYTPARLAAWVRWLRSTPQNLVADGSMAAVEGVWEAEAAPGSEAMPVEEGDRPAVRLRRDADEPGEVALTQPISRTVAADGWLQVRAVLRVLSHDASGCGERGDACPLALKLNYVDADGREHEWLQGFYVFSGPSPSFCTTCETRQAHIQVPAGEWYTYESANLLQSDEAAVEALMRGMPYIVPPPPHTIHSITVAAAGSSYEVEVAEVALISREGRPLPGLNTGTGDELSPRPVPLPVRAVPVQVDVAVPEPPPDPSATPAPTSTPEE